MNVVLLVVDSLRARSLRSLGAADGARTPFLDRLARETVFFRRAYATECWTLPTHVSMFTGLLPSEHGAHFGSMGYDGRRPTVAELLRDAGFHTEVVTRNSIFDGSLPGVTRGFAKNTLVLSDLRGANPLALFLAVSKPRFRRQIVTTGFFSAFQRESRAFVRTFAHATVPADADALRYTLERMHDARRRGTPYFFFVNLYDVHAPYPPARRSMFHPPWDPRGWLDTLVMPFVLPSLGGHAYLRDGFRMSATSRRLLHARYRRAIELMDEKLAAFHREARRSGLLDDTLLVVASDHGEGFGEHGLWLHDASVYDTHLHVPLWVHHPDVAPAVVDDVVSTRDLFGLLLAAGLGGPRRDTLLDPGHRAARPIAIAEHFHYPHVPHARPEFRQDLVAAVAADRKAIAFRDGVRHYDLARDPDETHGERAPVGRFVAACRAERLPTSAIHDAAMRLGRGAAAEASAAVAAR